MGNNVFGVNIRKRKRRALTTSLDIKGLKRKRSGRKCRVCGNDPWPNWFFCPVTCHEAVTNSIDDSMLEA